MTGKGGGMEGGRGGVGLNTESILYINEISRRRMYALLEFEPVSNAVAK